MTPKNEGSGKTSFPVEELRDVSREDADKEMEKFFEKLEDEMKDIPQEVIEAGAQKVIDFIKGKVSWAEIFNISTNMIKQITELGYLKFQAGRLEEAERFFKVLCILDSKNSYFRSMLGSILQRQKRHGEAIVQFTEAIDLNPHDVVSLVNRGEIFLQHGWLADAENDFKKVILLDPKKEDKWIARARLLLNKIDIIRKRRKIAEAPAKAEKKGLKK